MSAALVKSKILQRRVFERLLFAQCWEDPQMDLEALNVSRDSVVLSVTSGGCNTLSLATREPARVIAVDLNHTQNFLLELKMAGARRLSHGEYLELLGVRDSRARWDLYQSLRDELAPDARSYWDTQKRSIQSGILNAGRYERYLAAFRKLLRVIEGRKAIDAMLETESLAEQRRFYDENWDSRLWRLFFRVFFSRRVLGWGGLDPQFFAYVNGVESFGEHFRGLARHAMVDLPLRDNYFIAQICLGRYRDERSVPPYLLAENYEALRRAVDRIEIVTGEIGSILQRLPSDSVDCFNFSNVFEWVPAPTFETMLRETHRVARPGGRLCYRNLLVRRGHPSSLDHLFTPHEDLAARLLYRDRSFVYSGFEVSSVKKPAEPTGARR
jgi:S-adenosylmethionine-diacylglycerol 3-amino-3-carboxypropyl transferase